MPYQNPFLRGYFGSQEAADRKSASQISQLGGLLNIQNAMTEQQLTPLKIEQLRIAIAKAKQNQALVQQLTGGGGVPGGVLGGGQPLAFGAGGISLPSGGQGNVLSGQTAPPPQGASTASGVPPQVMGLLASGDPGLMAIGKAIQESQIEARKPIVTRGQPVIDASGRMIFQGGLNVPGMTYQYGPNGVPISASSIPGFAEGAGAISGTKAGAEAAGKAPYQLQTVNTPGAPTLMTGQQAIESATGQPMPVPGNNPLNLRPRGASTGFQQFGSQEEGLSAADRNLQAYARQGINTLSGIIGRWAPPTENDTQAYIADVSKRLSLDPNQPINLNDARVRHAISGAMMLHEQGPGKVFAQAGSQRTPGLRLQDQGQSAFQSGFGKEQAGLAGKTLEGGDMGRRLNDLASAMSSAHQNLQTAGGDVNKMAGITQTLTEYAQAFGIDPSKLNLPKDAGPYQLMDSVTNRFAMGMIGPGGMPANNFSEADREFLIATMSKKTDTPQGFAAKLDIIKKVADRNIEAEQSWIDAEAAGKSYSAWRKEWNTFVRGNPLYPKQDIGKAIQNAGNAGPTPQGWGIRRIP